jgi:hypothetical protein
MAYKKFEHYPLKMIWDNLGYLTIRRTNIMNYCGVDFLYHLDDNALTDTRIIIWTDEKIVTNDSILRNWIKKNILKEVVWK